MAKDPKTGRFIRAADVHPEPILHREPRGMPVDLPVDCEPTNMDGLTPADLEDAWATRPVYPDSPEDKALALLILGGLLLIVLIGAAIALFLNGGIYA